MDARLWLEVFLWLRVVWLLSVILTFILILTTRGTACKVRFNRFNSVSGRRGRSRRRGIQSVRRSDIARARHGSSTGQHILLECCAGVAYQGLPRPRFPAETQGKSCIRDFALSHTLKELQFHPAGNEFKTCAGGVKEGR